MDEELEQEDDFYRDIVRAELRSFWFRLLRVMPVVSDELTAGQMQNRRITMLEDFQILLSYMEDHASENIPLEKAAAMMHFSPSHFSKVFKQLIGIGYVKYLNLIRITQASELLQEEKSTIGQVSSRCGFQNVRTFNRVFKEITGVTPSEYLDRPDLQGQNFTYYKSSSNIMAYAEKDPLTIVK